jgi:alkylation response protein AidB-like acyl-CoA dehydrogenase
MSDMRAGSSNDFELLTPDHDDFRSSVRGFLASTRPLGSQPTVTDGYDTALWSRMAEEMGLQGLAIPTEFEGSGATVLELGIVMEEMGRTLSAEPLFATCALAVPLLLYFRDDPVAADYLTRIATGELVATVAYSSADGSWETSGDSTSAVQVGGGWHVTGESRFVLNGEWAQLLIVIAATPDGLSVFAVNVPDAGVSITSVSTLDLTRPQATVTFSDTPAVLLGGAPGHAPAALKATLPIVIALLAAEQTGQAQAVLDMSVQYAKDRVQFDRPIGSFQAVKHLCADMLVDVESCRSASYAALIALALERPDAPLLAASAQAFCSDACARVAETGIAVHGGIGFTWEHAAHLYFRRAKASQVMFGDASAHREAVARLIGL